MLFFDMKNHLLPDTEPFCSCAQDVEMAICMAFDAYNQGCRFIMVTPPDTAFVQAWKEPNGAARLLKRYQALCDSIRRYLPDMNFGLGCEIHCSRHNMEDVLEHLNKGHLPRMNDTQYVLVSFQDEISREDLWFCLDRLDQEGYLPILSHAQTLHALKGDIHEIRCLKGEADRDAKYRFRALIQIDTRSLHFSEQDHWGKEMIRKGVVDMLATDARNSFTHPPYIQEALSDISHICSTEYLEAISWHHAACHLLP